MKTKMFTTLFALLQATFRYTLFGLAMAILCTSVAVASATDATSTTTTALWQFAMPTGNYTGTATLAPAAGSGATVTVVPTFEGLAGFEDARLIATITGSGNVLTVTLVDFAGNELPNGETLGMVYVTEAGVTRTFEVVVDGGLVVVAEGDY
jgi:hypothetical protein